MDTVCQRVGRDPKEITFVAITKIADISQIQEILEAGLTHIGESKVQEAEEKFPALENADIKVTRHMVGHLQTNKVKTALEIFDVIQSVDSIKLAEVIEEQAAKLEKKIDILIQVNTSGEEQKFGAAPPELFLLINRIVELKHLRLQGLMTIAPLVEDKEVIRKCFRDLRFLKDAVEERFSSDRRVSMKYLSMGMSGDYQIAIEEGSSMVRIGRAIFCDQKE